MSKIKKYDIIKLYDDISKKHDVKVSDILISLRDKKIYCYKQDEFGYLLQIDIINMN